MQNDGFNIADKILEYLEQEDKARELMDIYKYLNLKTDDDLTNLQVTLEKLEKSGEVHITKKNKYLLMKYCPSLKVGKIDIAKNGFGFLVCEDGNDVFISRDNLEGAIDNDVALIDTFKRNGKTEGKVLKILERKNNNVIGEVYFNKNELKIRINDNKSNINFKKINNNFKNLVDGHVVLVELTNQVSSNEFIGTIIKVIGHKNDPDIDILNIAYKNNILLEFSDEVTNELKFIPDHVLETDKVGRVDLTNEEIFTIDGDDTKDIDDAISLKIKGDNYELGVHIADVSYYVKNGTNLYAEAYERGTSSYLADRVLPMLPHELSNGICSLNPNVERLAISCNMIINKKGEVIEYDIFPSVIKSNIKMTYKNVNSIIEDNIIPQGYEKYSNTILKMNELAKILRKRKIEKGYIEFDIPEAKIIQDENGKCIDIVKREQLSGEKLIEDFMIAANETVATHINNMGLPFIYRVHGTPKHEKIEDFINLLKIFNLSVNLRGIEASSLGMQRLLRELQDVKQKDILSSLLLRSMQKAVYDTNNIGHFGLGLRNYTHFTSPIRRLPDLLVHTLLRTYLFNKDLSDSTIRFYEKYLIEASEHASLKEQDAINAEREVVNMKMAEYMESHIGEIYTGIISSVTNFGFFVELPNLVEGLVHINTLKGYFNYVPEYLSLINKENNVKYVLGDEVTIKVVGSNKNSQQIDFEVIDGNRKQKSEI